MTRSPKEVSSREVSSAKKSEAPLGVGMVERRVTVAAREVVFLKGVLEAHEGLAQVYAEKGGDLILCTTTEQQGELDELLAKLSEKSGWFLAQAATRSSKRGSLV
jgi:hypothetical protein